VKNITDMLPDDEEEAHTENPHRAASMKFTDDEILKRYYYAGGSVRQFLLDTRITIRLITANMNCFYS
jgi:hypothetical protein